MSAVAAVVGDVVGSREHPNQATMLTDLRSAAGSVDRQVESLHPLRPTIGDEFQGIYETVAEAGCAIWRLRLVLMTVGQEPLDVRCGIGWGEVEGQVGRRGGAFAQQSGPGWWRARDQLERVEARAKSGRPPTLRMAVSGLADEGDPAGEAAFNAAFACADELFARLDHRSATIVLMTIDGSQQAEIADRLGISQPAVSARLRAKGLWTLVHSYRTLREVT